MKRMMIILVLLVLSTTVVFATSITTSPTLCTTNNDCSSITGTKCNTRIEYCTPVCTSNSGCGTDGVCNTQNGYCEVTCGIGCPTGTLCDTTANTCLKTTGCTCNAYFELKNGTKTGTGTLVSIGNSVDLSLKSVASCSGQYKFLLVENDGFTRLTLEIQPDDTIAVYTPTLSAGIHSTPWTTVYNPNNEGAEGGQGEFYFIVEKDNQELCRSATIENNLLLVYKTVFYNGVAYPDRDENNFPDNNVLVDGVLYNDLDNNGAPDGWCGSSSQPDRDCDQAPDSIDNCLAIHNLNQADTDQDGRGDLCDNCPTSYNPIQQNDDGDSLGNACDNCAYVTNQNQIDTNSNYIGDVCDGIIAAGQSCTLNGNCQQGLLCFPGQPDNTCNDATLCLQLGICQNLCEVITCSQGQVCQNGACIDQCRSVREVKLSYKSAVDTGLLGFTDQLRLKCPAVTSTIRINEQQTNQNTAQYYVNNILYSGTTGTYQMVTGGTQVKVVSTDLTNKNVVFKFRCPENDADITSCATVTCNSGQLCYQGRCVNECITSPGVNLLYDELNNGDVLNYKCSNMGYNLMPLSPYETSDAQQAFNFKVDEINYNTVVGSESQQVTGSARVGVDQLDITNKIATFQVVCPTTQETETGGGGGVDIGGDGDGSGGEETEPQECPGETCSQGEQCYMQDSITLEVDSIGIPVDDFSYVSAGCCVPQEGKQATCIGTQVTAAGIVLQLGRGECIDEDGDGAGYRDIIVRDSNGGDISPEDAEATGYPSTNFREDCTTRPQTITTAAPYYTPMMMILSMVLIGLYYLRKR